MTIAVMTMATGSIETRASTETRSSEEMRALTETVAAKKVAGKSSYDKSRSRKPGIQQKKGACDPSDVKSKG